MKTTITPGQADALRKLQKGWTLEEPSAHNDHWEWTDPSGKTHPIGAFQPRVVISAGWIDAETMQLTRLGRDVATGKVKVEMKVNASKVGRKYHKTTASTPKGGKWTTGRCPTHKTNRAKCSECGVVYCVKCQPERVNGLCYDCEIGDDVYRTRREDILRKAPEDASLCSFYRFGQMTKRS